MEGPKGGSCRAWRAMARGPLRLLLCVAALAPTVLAANQIKGLDDAILFRLNWGGGDAGLLDSPDYEKLVMTSSMNERYECLVPIKYGDNDNKHEIYKGPSPIALLMPLFKKQSCNLRLEPYWTYELCHGRHIKQYREEREGKNSNLLEFSLGIITKEGLAALSKQAEASPQEIPVNANIPTTKIEGLDTPYFMVNYTDGTVCDLTGRPRTSHVLFVCYEEGRHDIYSIKETYSCEYEIVVLSPNLCQHPHYRPRELPQTNLHCIPMEGSPKRPRNMLQIEAESLKLRSSDAILAGDTSSGSVKLEVLDDDEEDTTTTTTSSSSSSTSEPKPRVPLFSPQPAIDQKLVEDFLSGDYCLHGGSGWWKHEFCHGRKVEQYHEERDGTKTSILLGYFNMEDHKKWIAQNPEKSYKPGKRHVSHFYSGGTTCDVTGAPRQVEVKLKCKESSSPSSMAMYLQEPRTCEYVLVVETSIVCPLLRHADHLGWFSAAVQEDAQITKELSSSSSGPPKQDSHKGTVELTPLDEDEDADYDDDGDE